MTSPVSSTFTTSPSSPCPTISREEIAKIVAARRTPQRRIVVPDTDEWVEARREPLGRLAVGIRAKFEGPKAEGILEALNTLISKAVQQCETPEGPKRIRWCSNFVNTWIRCDPDGPAEQFLTLAGFGYELYEFAQYYHVRKWAQPEKRGVVKRLLEVAHEVLQDHLAQIKKCIQSTRNLKNREACLEKGRRENALRKIEADRRRVKERCEKEKEERRSAPQSVAGTETGTASPSNTSDASSTSDDASSASNDEF